MLAPDSSGIHIGQTSSNEPRKRKQGRPRKGMERLLPPEPKKKAEPKEEKPKEPIEGTVSDIDGEILSCVTTD